MNDEILSSVSDECLKLYKSTGFSQMPRYPMIVEVVVINFLVDSGACQSTLRPCDLPCVPKMTGKVYESTSASGHLISEQFTEPLECETDGGRTLKHKFLWSPKCPAPLMARDLICELNLTLHK